MSDYDRELDRNTASNMSLQVRPPMKQESHSAHNMPAPEHDGVVNKYPNKVKGMSDKEVDDNNSRRPPLGEGSTNSDY